MNFLQTYYLLGNTGKKKEKREEVVQRGEINGTENNAAIKKNSEQDESASLKTAKERKTPGEIKKEKKKEHKYIKKEIKTQQRLNPLPASLKSQQF